MAARCFNDTCSTTVTEVTNPSAFEINVETDEAQGIACAEPNGLYVKVAAAGCNQILSFDGSGNLQALLRDATITEFDDANRVAVPQSADTGDLPGTSIVTASHSYTNNSGCEQLVIVSGVAMFQYAVLGENYASNPAGLLRTGDITTSAPAVEVVPYNAQVTSLIEYGIDVAPVLTGERLSFNIGGVMGAFKQASGQNYQIGLDRRSFSFSVALATGSTLNVWSRWAYQGNDQNMNLVAQNTGVADFSTLGAYIKNGQFTALPIGVA